MSQKTPKSHKGYLVVASNDNTLNEFKYYLGDGLGGTQNEAIVFAHNLIEDLRADELNGILYEVTFKPIGKVELPTKANITYFEAKASK